jgi:hypothetical protein
VVGLENMHGFKVFKCTGLLRLSGEKVDGKKRLLAEK